MIRRPFAPGSRLPGGSINLLSLVETMASAAPHATASISPKCGFGVRAALGSYDAGHTAVSQLKKGDIDWDQIFVSKARLVSHRGIFCALSATTPTRRQTMQSRSATCHRLLRSELPRFALEISRWQKTSARSKPSHRSARRLMLGNEEDFSAASATKFRHGRASLRFESTALSK